MDIEIKKHPSDNEKYYLAVTSKAIHVDGTPVTNVSYQEAQHWKRELRRAYGIGIAEVQHAIKEGLKE